MTFELLAFYLSIALVAVAIVGVVCGVSAMLCAATAPWRDRMALARFRSQLRTASAAAERAKAFIAEHPELRPLPQGCWLT